MKVVVERNISADESVEQDPQGPDGGGLTMVAAVQQPLGRGVNPSTSNIFNIYIILLTHESVIFRH